jgi:hypothetical protein
MFLNYVDFGYWDYGYAEGDIKSIQEAIAQINGVGFASSGVVRIRTVLGSIFSSLQFNAITNAVVSAFSSFTGVLNFESSVTRNRLISGNVEGTANVLCSAGYLFSLEPNFLGNGFLTSRANAIFATQSSVLALGTVLSSGYIVGEEWGAVSDEANTWTEAQLESNTWTERTAGTNVWQ